MRACVANHKISEILRTNFFFPNFAVLLSPNMFRKRPFPDTGMAICLFLAMTVVLLIAAPYRIGFKEQIGIFYWADDRLSWYLSNPAVAASIIGDWLTQFYYSNTAGVLITVLLLALLWMEIIRLSRLVRGDNHGVTVTVLPVLVAGSLIVWPNYPVSSLVGLIISVWMACLVGDIRNRVGRLVAIILLIPLIFVLAGGNVLVFALACLMHKKGKKRFDVNAVILGMLIVLVLAAFYRLNPNQALLYPISTGFIIPAAPVLFLLPASIIICLLASHIRYRVATAVISAACSVVVISTIYNDVLEFSVKVGTLAYRSEWGQVRELASDNLDTQYGLYYRNLSYAREGTLPDALLKCDQGLLSDGLFLSTSVKDPYLSKFYFTDALLEMGDVSRATDCALFAQTVTPGYYSTRMLRRLSEISVITGDYQVASKYLYILSKTRFHSEWAGNMMDCIRKDSIPKQYLVLRSRTSDHDRFFDLNDIHSSLYVISSDNPRNRCAIDYLMCSSLLDKDMANFRHLFDKFWLGGLERLYNVPELYQEALLVDVDSEESLKRTVSKYHISDKVLERFLKFMEIKSKNLSALKAHKELHDTYWYYTLTAITTYAEN